MSSCIDYDGPNKLVGMSDFIVDRLGTADGISSAFRICEYIGRWIQYLPNISSSSSSKVAKFSETFFKANTLVGAFSVVEPLRDCGRSYALLANSTVLGFENRKTILSNVSSVARNTLSTINAASDVANNLNDAGYISLGSRANLCSGIYSATDIVCNLLNVKEEANAIHSRNLEASNGTISSQRKGLNRLKDHISKCKIFNSSLGIIGSGLALISLITGAFTILPIISLSLSTIWISVKLYTQFRESPLKST